MTWAPNKVQIVYWATQQDLALLVKASGVFLCQLHQEALELTSLA